MIEEDIAEVGTSLFEIFHSTKVAHDEVWHLFSIIHQYCDMGIHVYTNMEKLHHNYGCRHAYEVALVVAGKEI